MDLQVPLNKLKFGHEDGEGINARITGRDDGIAALAANIFANRSDANRSGLIENLIVKDAGNGFYSVANGNRRLAALHMVDGRESELLIGCTLHRVDGTKAFEYSLTTAITAEQLHPVDQYEAFARLEEHGKTEEEIARQYGMGEKQVRQALALGRLSPTIRDAWRKGEIKAEVAQAFTLSADHKQQDKLFKKLSKEHDLDRASIRAELGVKSDDDIGALVNFVGIEAYRARGGHVTEDLFKEQHIVSDGALLKEMVAARLQKECDRLVVEDGWQWAAITEDLPKSWHTWPVTRVTDISKFFTPEEAELAKQLSKRQEEIEEAAEYDWEAEQEVDEQIERLEQSVLPRAFTEKQKAKLGCKVAVDDDGRLDIVYGISRPAAASQLEAAAAQPTAGEPAPVKPKKTGKAAEPDLSQALIQRLSIQLTKAAETALIQDQDLAISVLLAKFASNVNTDGIQASVSGLGASKLDLLGAKKFADNLELARALKPAQRIELLVLVAGAALNFQRFSSSDDNLLKGNPGLICDAIKPDAMNAALRGAFDAKDYFDSVPKTLCLAAIKEAMGADAARQQEKKKGGEIAAFAIANVPATGWLPPSLRVKGYDGPPVKKAGAVVAMPDAKKTKAKPGPTKRAAAAKKTAKKTSKKKR